MGVWSHLDGQDFLAGIDRIEANRSRFIAEAVRHELRRSLEAPHRLQLLYPLQDRLLDRLVFRRDLQRQLMFNLFMHQLLGAVEAEVAAPVGA